MPIGSADVLVTSSICVLVSSVTDSLGASVYAYGASASSSSLSNSLPSGDGSDSAANLPRAIARLNWLKVCIRGGLLTPFSSSFAIPETMHHWGI
ncbi:hypothetical protein PF001_g22282 [Phytophthora fragariae]|uniref:Uncharacterized protein n=1 Tax=Phytophthora fragariae TaxID=53985 RepID=A0A6A4C6P5_9STRA|nr:hypothetical protein PF006_g22327 [Phytophthora fragariae]KAE9284638.1 hypothetical protein PF001_g22282 [Phytophthora fragariae]